MIRLEVKKQVKTVINEVLADKFLDVISEKKDGDSFKPSNAYTLTEQKKSSDRKAKEDASERSRLNNLKAKISKSVPSELFEDITTEQVANINNSTMVPGEVEPSLDDIESLLMGGVKK